MVEKVCISHINSLDKRHRLLKYKLLQQFLQSQPSLVNQFSIHSRANPHFSSLHLCSFGRNLYPKNEGSKGHSRKDSRMQAKLGPFCNSNELLSEWPGYWPPCTMCHDVGQTWWKGRDGLQIFPSYPCFQTSYSDNIRAPV